MSTASENPALTLEESDNYRNRLRRRVRVSFIFFLLLPAAGIPAMVMIQDNRGVFFGILILLILNFFRHVFAYVSAYKLYEAHFKKHVLGKLVPSVFPGLTLVADAEPPASAVEESRLLANMQYTFLVCPSLVSGVIDGTSMTIASVLARIPDPVGGSTAHGDVLFDGLFLSVGLAEPVIEPVWIGPRLKGLGTLSAMLPANSLVPQAPQLDLGMPDFEEKFSVHGTSPEAGQQLLTTARRSILLEMQTAQSSHYYLGAAFIGSTLYVAVNHAQEIYSIYLKKSVTDPGASRVILADIGQYRDWLMALSTG